MKVILNELIAPMVHMNGDNKRTLLDNHCEAMNALRDAIEKLPEVNGRNYYCIPEPNALDKAMEQRKRWADTLRKIRSEIELVAEAIDAQ